MKSVALATFALGATALQNVRENFAGDRVLDIHVEHMSETVRNLLHAHDGDHIGTHNDHFSIKVTPDIIEKLTLNGVSFEDTTEKWIEQLQSNLDDPNLFCTEGAEACAARDTQSFFSNYQDLDAILTRIKGLVADSDLAEIKVIGKTTEGRDINLVEIANDESKPLAYFMCNIHAREWLTPMYCTYMIEMLLANGGHPLLDTFSFAIIPSGNQDGYVYSRTSNNMWRKTRNTNSGSSCIGTDANRNYDDHHCGDGTSNNPCSDIYCGPKPFSTPETTAVNNYGQQNRDRLIAWSDFHSYGGYWLSPLGYTTGLPPAVDYDRMYACMSDAVAAVRAETGSRFTAGGAGDLLGAAAGASDDYHYFEYGVIYSFTVEMRGPSFQPSTSNIDPAMRETFAGMVAEMECISRIELEGESVPSVPPTPAPVCGTFFC